MIGNVQSTRRGAFGSAVTSEKWGDVRVRNGGSVSMCVGVVEYNFAIGSEKSGLNINEECGDFRRISGEKRNFSCCLGFCREYDRQTWPSGLIYGFVKNCWGIKIVPEFQMHWEITGPEDEYFERQMELTNWSLFKLDLNVFLGSRFRVKELSSEVLIITSLKLSR